MVMDKLIGETIDEDDAEKIKEVNRLFDVLYDNGITHGDISYKNAMYAYAARDAEKKERVWLIDFEMATESGPVPRAKREYLNVID
jgi:tRNA A-37 threonylcarbamoyl transferase component Bud32